MKQLINIVLSPLEAIKHVAGSVASKAENNRSKAVIKAHKSKWQAKRNTSKNKDEDLYALNYYR